MAAANNPVKDKIEEKATYSRRGLLRKKTAMKEEMSQHGQFKKWTKNQGTDISWDWFSKSNFKRDTEKLVV